LLGGPAAAAVTLNVSAVLLALATVGVLVAARVVLAILLAVAPAMAGFLLFDSTRGIAQGWIGAMAALALAPLFILLIAAIEFAILSPMTARLLAEQAAGNFDLAPVMPIGLVTLIFGISLLIAIRAAGRMGQGIRFNWKSGPAVPQSSPETSSGTERQPLLPSLSSAESIANSLRNVARRDSAPQPGTRRWIDRIAANDQPRNTSRSHGPAEVYPAQRPSNRPLAVPRQSRAAVRRDS
jgi:type IV secretion system protein VirB6